METSSFICAFIFLLINNLTLSSSTPVFNLTTDESALLAFKHTITSDPDGVLLNNWFTNTSICLWTGVSCGSKKHRVTALNVSGFGLRGTIAPHLGNLTFLRSLDLSSNNFTGSVPGALSNLRCLMYINLRLNGLEGEIPPWLGALSQLQQLHLNNNSFSGQIPGLLFNISRLETLDFGYNSLDGNIPEEIGNASSLENLILIGNRITGSIPNSVFNISSLIRIDLDENRLSGELSNDMCSNANPKLKRMYLSRNKLSGEIPASIHKCRELEDLRLVQNSFSGSIPSEIGRLTMLRVLSLSYNNFTGSIPRQFGNLTSLTWLECAGNLLTGELPQELGNRLHLEVFAAPDNNLAGVIPSSIFNISTMRRLYLQQNFLSGSLPSAMGLSLLSLEELVLSYNRLNGEIPHSIINASKLHLLELNKNSFSGSIPNFGSLRLLNSLRLWENKLIGAHSPTQELSFLSSLTNCRELEVLEISDNPLNGILPTSIGNLSISLVRFLALRCNINGGIPSEIGNLTNLQALHLSQNNLEGSIPSTMRSLNQMVELLLGLNQLQGFIPNEFCQMRNLVVLRLSHNMLTGPIHECLGELVTLREVIFSTNKLNSTIPSKFWNLVNLVTLNLSSNFLSGQISPQIGSWKISQMDLSFNQFTGDIPSSIDGCQSLEGLYLSNNKFGGTIPESLGNVRGLRTLDLSNNALSGSIPKSLQDLGVLEHLNVSYNNLKGEIPEGGPFAYFTAQSFVNNSALCGAKKFQVPPCVKDNARSRFASVMKYILPSFIAAIILVTIMIVIIRRCKQTNLPHSADISLEKIARRRISYAELVRGTSSFSETSLLGRGSFGSVFKATLSDGLDIAVKVFNLQLEGATKSFDTESKILSSIRHRNLVPVIGCCTNTEFRALILKYMPNGSLEKWLHSGGYSLDITQCLEIAADIALALEYLHHGHTFPVVHCDIKPSNVLLDEDMTAHVGDFGISKLFDKGEAVTQTTTLATIGYAAPEYGSEGKVSTNGDVYSYGILLLEMLTRKKPTDDMFNEEMGLKEWVSDVLQYDAVSEVVPPGLLSTEDQHVSEKEQCVVSSILGVAMKCLALSPDERINMIQVVASLQKIKHKVTESTRLNNRRSTQ